MQITPNLAAAPSERYMNKIDFSTISTDRLLLRFVLS